MAEPQKLESAGVLFTKIDQHREEITHLKIEQARQDERIKTLQTLAENTLIQMTGINAKLETLNESVQQAKGAANVGSKIVEALGPKGVAAVVAVVGAGAAAGTKLIG